MLAGKDSAQGASALEELCGTYWYPLYAYARRQGKTAPDAQDLTQQFFGVFLEKKYFSLANQDRGRFRSFLLGSFKHFLANEYHRSRAAKRGGGYAFVSWDEAEAEKHYANEPACEMTPDKLFEQAWAFTVLQKVMETLRGEYARAHKAEMFAAVEIFLTSQKSDLTYKDIGERLSMSESAIKMTVSRLRQRYGELLRREVAQTVTDPASVEEELRHLLSALS